MRHRIVNNIDVTECKFHSVSSFNDKDFCELHRCGTYDDLECQENPNCYFKQLARIKSEIFSLEDLITLQENDIARYCKALVEIEKKIRINCEEICGRKIENCTDISCLSQDILNIIRKAKEIE